MSTFESPFIKPAPAYTRGPVLNRQRDEIIAALTRENAETLRQLREATAEIAELKRAAISQEQVITALRRQLMVLGGGADSSLTALQIIHAVSDATGCPAHVMMSRTRMREVAIPRMMACALLAELKPTMSLPKLADYFYRGDHSCVVHALKRVHDLVRAGKAPTFWIPLRRKVGLPDAVPEVLRGRIWTLKRK